MNKKLTLSDCLADQFSRISLVFCCERSKKTAQAAMQLQELCSDKLISQASNERS